MRTMMLMLLLLAAPALAQERDATGDELLWVKAQRLASVGDGVERLKNAGVTEDGARKIVAYFRIATAEVQAKLESQLAATCEKKELYRSSPAAFADKLAADEAEVNALRKRKLDADIPEVSASDKDAFLKWARSGVMRVVETLDPAQIRSGQYDPEQVCPGGGN